ncbi:hypothetical protein [Rhodococcus sp. NPDC003322]
MNITDINHFVNNIPNFGGFNHPAPLPQPQPAPAPAPFFGS